MNIRAMKRTAAAVALLLAGQLLLACTEDAVPPVSQSTPEVIATSEPLATHVVAQGDRLVDIAAQYEIPLARLLEWNDFPNPDVIEVGDVVVLEDPEAATAAPAPVDATALPRLVQTEVVEETFSDRVRAWWADAPKPSLSGDAVQQGIFAAVALPLVVVALLLAWLGVRLLVRGVRWTTSRARSSTPVDGGAASELPGSGEGSRAVPPAEGGAGSVSRGSTVVRSQLARGAVAVGLGARRAAGIAGRAIAVSAAWIAARLAAAGRAIGRAVVGGAAWTAGLLHLGARRAADAHAARRERARDEEIRRESRRWWSQGRERLRIGLLDEAEAAFETGLKMSVEGGWQEEIALYREELKLLEERRSVERSLVPSVTES